MTDQVAVPWSGTDGESEISAKANKTDARRKNARTCDFGHVRDIHTSSYGIPTFHTSVRMSQFGRSERISASGTMNLLVGSFGTGLHNGDRTVLQVQAQFPEWKSMCHQTEPTTPGLINSFGQSTHWFVVFQCVSVSFFIALCPLTVLPSIAIGSCSRWD